jgi:Fructose-bisphosphate aldolase class-I
LYKETLAQSSSDGVPFVDCLARQGILPGIKVDEVGLLLMCTCHCRVHVARPVACTVGRCVYLC